MALTHVYRCKPLYLYGRLTHVYPQHTTNKFGIGYAVKDCSYVNGFMDAVTLCQKEGLANSLIC